MEDANNQEFIMLLYMLYYKYIQDSILIHSKIAKICLEGVEIIKKVNILVYRQSLSLHLSHYNCIVRAHACVLRVSRVLVYTINIPSRFLLLT